FQTCGEPPRDAGSRVARTVMLALALSFLALICFPVFAAVYGAVVAATSLGFAVLVAMILADVCLSGYRSIPFTCSWAPGKNNPAFAIALYTGAFFIFVSALSEIEHWMLGGIAR